MGCNSCSNITLPGAVGSQGAPGEQGTAGPIGPQGPAGASVSVLDVDFTVYDGFVSSFPIVPQKSVIIPADTWENEHDMLELEMMFQAKGKVARLNQPSIKIKVGSSDVDLYSANPNNQIDFFDDLKMSANDNNIVKIRLQLPMSQLTGTQGTIIPVIETDMFTGTSNGQEYYSISGPVKSIYGRSNNSFVVGDVTGPSPIELYMMHSTSAAVEAASFKLIYYKLLSYKKIV